jgi:hypothetical protein
MTDPRTVLAIFGFVLAAIAFLAFLVIGPIMQWRMG